MGIDEPLLRIEEEFWRGDAEFYRQNLTEDCLMVFAEPVGTLGKDAAVASIGAHSRWVDVAFREIHVVAPTDDVKVLTYEATAHREDAAQGYSALASSVYVHRGGAWKLAFHQQTPRGQ